jgi:DNA end-binding protein Ku
VAQRAIWKGYLKIAELTCKVALYSAVSTSERISFRIVDKTSGHRVERRYIDSETKKPVASENQVKGYETGKDQYVVLEPDEIASVLPQSDKTIAVEAFIAHGDIDEIYFDRPYFLAPADAAATEAFALIREGLERCEVAALGRAMLFRRIRPLLVRPYGEGLVATTLLFDYEIRPAAGVFGDIAKRDISDEMLALAEHIIATKRGNFDPATFTDRYESALAALVRAKIDGKPLPVKTAPAGAKIIDLMEALRKSAGAAGEATKSRGSRTGQGQAKGKAKAPRRVSQKRKTG